MFVLWIFKAQYNSSSIHSNFVDINHFNMYFLRFSINNFTLLAIVIAIGLVVDDSVVMLDNITRHRNDLKKSSINAALDGSKEIAVAIIVMTLSRAAIFLPTGFLKKKCWKLFIEFACTLAVCVLFSEIVSLTLTPMICSRIFWNKNW